MIKIQFLNNCGQYRIKQHQNKKMFNYKIK